MKRNLIVAFLIFSIVLTVVFVVGSFVTYAEPTSSTEMQNIYLGRIMRFGVPVFLFQLAAVVLLLLEGRKLPADRSN